MTIWCCAPEHVSLLGADMTIQPGSQLRRLHAGEMVQPGSVVFIELTLPDSGYLLISIHDQEKLMNLFPGTERELRQHYYHVPASITTPATRVMEMAKREGNRYTFGGFVVDDTPGDQLITAYYSPEIMADLETELIKAEPLFTSVVEDVRYQGDSAKGDTQWTVYPGKGMRQNVVVKIPVLPADHIPSAGPLVRKMSYRVGSSRPGSLP